MKKIFRIFIYAIIFFAAGLNAFEITGDTQIVVRGGKSAASANFAAAEIAGYQRNKAVDSSKQKYGAFANNHRDG